MLNDKSKRKCNTRISFILSEMQMSKSIVGICAVCRFQESMLLPDIGLGKGCVIHYLIRNLKQMVLYFSTKRKIIA